MSEEISNKVGPYFCTAPWTHTHITPHNVRRLCGISKDRELLQFKSDGYQPITLEEHWNGEKMKGIRKSMLAGERIPECDTCNNSTLNIHTYRQHFNGDAFKDRINSIIENTDETGYTTLKPISFDYRVSNICNFKCRMCDEHLSSAWEVEKKMHGLTNSTNRAIPIVDKSKKETYQISVLEKELWDAAESDQLEEIYWAGGEPLMYQIHWDLMEYLVKTGKSKNVSVRYNTNLSRISYKSSNFYDLLPHFKNVTVQASMDGTGDIAEYIRTGLKWEEWLENVRKGLFLNRTPEKSSLVLDVTITTPGLFSMKEIMNLAIELNLNSQVKTCYDFSPFDVMSPLVLPKHLLDKVLDDLIDYEASLNSDLTKVYSDTFKSLKTRETFEAKYENHLDGIRKGKSYQLQIEQIRPNAKTNIEQIFSMNAEIADWWMNI